MWIEVHSVKPTSQAGNIWVKDIVATQKGQSRKKWARELKNLKFYRGPSVHERTMLGLCINLWDYIWKVVATLLSGSRKGAVGA